MIVGLVSWIFVVVGRVRGDAAGGDLAHVGEELGRLRRDPGQPATISR